MPSTEHVRRLARELVLPDGADVVVRRTKYWRASFCWLFFARCDVLIWQSPEDGLGVAELAPELVALTEMRTGEQDERLQLHSLVVLATAYWAAGEVDQAEEAYRRGFRMVRESRSLLRSDFAFLLCRFGNLLCSGGRTDSALRVLRQSVEVYRDAPDDVRCRWLGEALLIRGLVHDDQGRLELALIDWAEAVSCTDERQASRVWHTAMHNLLIGLMQGGVPARELCQVEGYVTRAGRTFHKKLLSVEKLKVFLAQGMIQMRFGSTRRGEATFRRVIEGFLKLGALVDVALVRVTLAMHRCREGSLEALKSLAIETDEECRREGVSEEIQRTLFIFKETVVAGTVSPAVFDMTWQVLEQCSYERATGLRRKALCAQPRIERVRPVHDVEARRIA